MIKIPMIYKIVIISPLLFIIWLNCIGQNNIERHPKTNSIQKNLTIAKSLINKNKENEALDYLNIILSEKYNHEEALLLRAKIYNNQQVFDKALVDYNALVILLPQNKEVLYARGMARYQLAQYNLAIDDFMQVVNMPSKETNTAFFKIDPNTNLASGVSTLSTMDAEIWNHIGLCNFKSGNYEEAIVSYNRGIDIGKNSPDLHLNRGAAYEKIGKLELAMQDYQFVLSISPENEIASFNLLNIKMNNSVKHDLIESLEVYISVNPFVAEGYTSRGLYYYEIHNFELAIHDFKDAVKLDPENTDYQFNLALCQEKLGKSHEAEMIFLKITELDPTHSGAYFNLGNLKFKQKQYDDAISYYTIAHHLNPKNASIIYNRALAYFKNNQLNEACKDIKEAINIDEDLALDFYLEHCIDLD